MKKTVFKPEFEVLGTNMAVVLPQRENTVQNVRDIAEDLAVDIVHYVSKSQVKTSPNKHARTLRRTADEVLTRHEIVFKSMLRKLELSWEEEVISSPEDSDSDCVDGAFGKQLNDSGLSDSLGSSSEGESDVDFPPPCVAKVRVILRDVADDLFADNIYNWGRIVTLFAFGGLLGKHLVENGLKQHLDEVAHCVSEIVGEKLAVWIFKHGGWVSFCATFRI